MNLEQPQLSMTSVFYFSMLTNILQYWILQIRCTSPDDPVVSFICSFFKWSDLYLSHDKLVRLITGYRNATWHFSENIVVFFSWLFTERTTPFDIQGLNCRLILREHTNYEELSDLCIQLILLGTAELFSLNGMKRDHNKNRLGF